MLVHAGQDEHDVDVVGLDHRVGAADVGSDVEVASGSLPLADVDVVDRAHVDASAGGESLDHARVRSREDTPAPEDADAKTHAAPLATA